MKAFEMMVPDVCNVRRNGSWIRMDVPSLVPGDIVRVSCGERVPADIRIIEVSSWHCFLSL